MNRKDTNNQVLALVAAYTIGLLALVLAIAVADSPFAAGLALAWILAVLLYTRHALRCPLCGASVLNAGVGAGLRWLSGQDRKCPRCKASYYEAASARAGSRGPGGKSREDGK